MPGPPCPTSHEERRPGLSICRTEIGQVLSAGPGWSPLQLKDKSPVESGCRGCAGTLLEPAVGGGPCRQAPPPVLQGCPAQASRVPGQLSLGRGREVDRSWAGMWPATGLHRERTEASWKSAR
ncbi:unnamed protein product [Gulo gulo]|uniref:Uncharacterized protein n=1 Tax=Gulo gulo TaxID=48420 RepID=A0A9X9LJT4_GULGU|nr:unnamed protein product [Gulo gulo]